MGYVEGVNRDQSMIFSLDDMVATDSMVRVIDRFIEVSDFTKLGFTKTKPSDTGRPPYSPKIPAKLYVYGYVNGIRSSRKLEQETKRNIEAMWLMDNLTPDYTKTFSRVC